MYLDAANRKIKDPIDYLIEAEKRSRKFGIPLHLAGQPELAKEADALHQKILNILSEQPIEVWETARHPNAIVHVLENM